VVLTQFKSMPVVRREQHEDGRSLGDRAQSAVRRSGCLRRRELP
jgi:hypothetical protein